MSKFIGIAVLISSLSINGVSIKDNNEFCQDFQCPTQISQKVQSWGVVFHAATTLSSAQNESSRVKKLVQYSPSIFKCNNWYRGVFVSSSRRQAVQLLSEAQTKIRSDSDLVDMNIWCPGKQKIAR
ncbi:MAG: hypothetical protein KGQ93_03460 [Cyanobacteria bacterium REEB459]|nr:hypothetical protein [Cyanobacteria bacterium REEB459]